MKKFTTVGMLVGLLTLSVLSAQAASLTKIYDFRDKFDATKVSFEGLDFTNDGTLWITSAPNDTSVADSLIGVNLEKQTVVNTFSYNQKPLTFNPVGLASDGTTLFMTNNLSAYGIYTGGLYKDTAQIDGQASLIKSISSFGLSHVKNRKAQLT